MSFMAVGGAAASLLDLSIQEENKGLLWEVSDDSGHIVYVMGTMHSNCLRINSTVEACLRDSSHFAVEMDEALRGRLIEELSRERKEEGYLDSVSRVLKNYLSLVIEKYPGREKYSYSSGLRLPIMLDVGELFLSSKEPLVIPNMTLELAHMELALKPVSADALDFRLERKARSFGCEIESVDNLDQMLEGVRRLRLGIIEEFSDCEDLTPKIDLVREMLVSWKTGKTEVFIREAEDPKAKEIALMEERNAVMIAKVEEYFERKIRGFMAVGIFHCVGEGGVIPSLKHKGHSVRQIIHDESMSVDDGFVAA